MLTTLVFAGSLLALANADFTVSVLQKDIVSGVLLDSVLLSLPPCRLAGQSVDLIYSSNNTNNTLTNIFTVPACGGSGKEGGTLVSRKVGYQVSNLETGGHYSLQYHVGREKSNVVRVSTKAAKDYDAINTGLPARSGAMVVITVILSVAMFILMVGLIVSLVLGKDDD